MVQFRLVTSSSFLADTNTIIKKVQENNSV